MSKQNQPLPEWLQEQQHHSWQIEILIASGFIFFLLQVPNYLESFLKDIAQSSEINSAIIILLIGGYIFSRALLIGFIVNLVLRALWLAMLGINFAFPEGVDYRRLKYSEYISQKIKNTPSVSERILQIEKFSSLSYSITIIMTLMSLGIFIFLSLLFLIIGKLLPSFDSPFYGYIFMALAFLISLGVMDEIFFGWLRKFNRLSKWYYPLHRFFRIISLQFLYRKEWLTIISNIRKWKIYLVFSFYFLLAFVIVSNDVASFFNTPGMFKFDFYENRKHLNLETWRRKIYSFRYDNLRQKGEKIHDLGIQSDVIKDRHLKLFVPYRYWFDDALGRILSEKEVEEGRVIRSLKRNEYLEQDSLTATAFSDFFTVYIDESKLDNLDWMFFDHPDTKEKGFITYVDTDSLSAGKHYLQLWLKTIRKDSLMDGRYREIPFVKE